MGGCLEPGLVYEMKNSNQLKSKLLQVMPIPIFVLLALAALFESTVEISSVLFEPQAGIALPES